MSGGPTNHCTKRISAGGGGLSRRDFVHAASGPLIGYINNPLGPTLWHEHLFDYFCRKINSLFTLVLAARVFVEKGKRRRLLWEQ